MTREQRRWAIWATILLFPSVVQGITPDHQSLASSWIFRFVQSATSNGGASEDCGPPLLVPGAHGYAQSISLVGVRVDGDTHFLCPLNVPAPFKKDRGLRFALTGPIWRGPSIGLTAWLCRFLC